MQANVDLREVRRPGRRRGSEVRLVAGFDARRVVLDRRTPLLERGALPRAAMDRELGLAFDLLEAIELVLPDDRLRDLLVREQLVAAVAGVASADARDPFVSARGRQRRQ